MCGEVQEALERGATKPSWLFLLPSFFYLFMYHCFTALSLVKQTFLLLWAQGTLLPHSSRLCVAFLAKQRGSNGSLFQFQFLQQRILLVMGQVISCVHRQLLSLRSNQQLMLCAVGNCISFRCGTIWLSNVLVTIEVIRCVFFFLHHLIFTAITYTHCASLSRRIIILVC